MFATIVDDDFVGAEKLERWLCGPDAPPSSLDRIAAAFGVPMATARPLEDSAVERLRFTLMVLRDAFPDDWEMRRWLREPSMELEGIAPLDLLLRGSVDQLEALAVIAWNRRSAA